MDEETNSDRTKVERRGEREVAATRVFDAPVHLVFEAWSKPELFILWWPPKSIGIPILSCEMDVRTGGGYRIVFGHDEASAMAFFGKYLEVVPLSRMVWTNDEGGEAGSVTSVTFEAYEGDKTLVVMSETFQTKEALDEGIGAMDGAPEQFAQLDDLLVTLRKGG